MYIMFSADIGCGADRYLYQDLLNGWSTSVVGVTDSRIGQCHWIAEVGHRHGSPITADGSDGGGGETHVHDIV